MNVKRNACKGRNAMDALLHFVIRHFELQPLAEVSKHCVLGIHRLANAQRFGCCRVVLALRVHQHVISKCGLRF
jgi:hypothetical protein